LLQSLALDQPLVATLVFDYPHVAALTDYLGAEMLGWRDAAPEVALPLPDGGSAAALNRLESLSDDEIDRLLAERAATLASRRN
jgi:hypothetical protein